MFGKIQRRPPLLLSSLFLPPFTRRTRIALADWVPFEGSRRLPMRARYFDDAPWPLARISCFDSPRLRGRQLRPHDPRPPPEPRHPPSRRRNPARLAGVRWRRIQARREPLLGHLRVRE